MSEYVSPHLETQVLTFQGKSEIINCVFKCNKIVILIKLAWKKNVFTYSYLYFLFGFWKVKYKNVLILNT